MTVQVAPETGSTVSLWEGDTGLEDFSSSDVSMPRLVIDHDEIQYKDSQTEELFDALEVVLFGLHKGRIMWGDLSDGDDTDPPLCKSTDFQNGFPNMDTDLGKAKQFPWAAQDVYKPEDAKPIVLPNGKNTLPALGCDTCKFHEWNTDPSGKRPWCAEVWTFPLVYKVTEANGDIGWVPALFSVKRSALKPARNYVTPFATRKVPLFTVVTNLSLRAAKRGKNEYGIPTFTKGVATAQEDWQMYRDQFIGAKAFLSQYPMPVEQDGINEDDIHDNDVQDAEFVAEPAPTPTPEPASQPVSTAGKIRQRGAEAPSAPSRPVAPQTQTTASVSAPQQTAGTAEIEDDEEPPF